MRPCLRVHAGTGSRRRPGLALVQVLLLVLVASIVMGPILGSVLSGKRGITSSLGELELMQAAQSLLDSMDRFDRLRQIRGRHVTLPDPHMPGKALPEATARFYHATATLEVRKPLVDPGEPVPSDTRDLLEVTLRISWKERDRPRETILSTLRGNHSGARLE